MPFLQNNHASIDLWPNPALVVASTTLTHPSLNLQSGAAHSSKASTTSMLDIYGFPARPTPPAPPTLELQPSLHFPTSGGPVAFTRQHSNACAAHSGNEQPELMQGTSSGSWGAAATALGVSSWTPGAFVNPPPLSASHSS